LTGQTFGKLTALNLLRVERIKRGLGALWLCRCACGEQREAFARQLRSGSVRSCRKCAARLRTKRLRAAYESWRRRTGDKLLAAETLTAAQEVAYENILQRRRRLGLPVTRRTKAEALDCALREFPHNG
jgi:hypothetical protein